MITLFFVFLLISVVIRLIWFAIKCAWGVTKVVGFIVLLPAICIVLALSGCVALAIPILVVVGVVSLIQKAA